MTALIVIGSIAAYIIGVGITGQTLENVGDYDNNSITSFAFVWPLTVMLFIGIALANTIMPGSSGKADRLKKRRQQELDEANHKAEIARIEENTIKMLEEANRR